MRVQTNLRRVVFLSVLVALVAAPGGTQKTQQAATPTGLAELVRGVTLRLPPGTRKLDNDAIKRLGQGVTLQAAQPAKEALLSNVNLWQAR